MGDGAEGRIARKAMHKHRRRGGRPIPSAVPIEVLEDDRFKHVLTDPKFRPMPKHETKVKIDERFGKMFTDKRFKIKATMDKRGRPVSTTTTEDLKRYYHLEEEEEDDEHEDKVDNDDEDNNDDKDEGSGQQHQESPSDGDDGDDNDDSSTKKHRDPSSNEDVTATGGQQRPPHATTKDDKLTKSNKSARKTRRNKEAGAVAESSSSEDELLDLARGEGNIETSEEDSSDSSDDDDNEEALLRAQAEQEEIEWDEMDKDAPRNENISSRLAVCNMDWHNLKAVDLFVLMSSFAQDGGVVKAVTIYPSEFGKQRMREEAQRGPRLQSKSDQALRKYEFDRLRYYYAVVECDSAETANKIYESCDGTEYQTSGAKIDLRFIPDEMTFDDDEPTDYADCAPQHYEPVDFVNSALMQSECESNWDGDDVRRRKALARLYSSDSKSKRKRAAGPKVSDIDEMVEHLKTYIASSDTSGDDDDGEDDNEDDDNVESSNNNNNNDNSSSSNKKTHKGKKRDAETYRRLLLLQDGEGKQDDADKGASDTVGAGPRRHNRDMVDDHDDDSDAEVAAGNKEITFNPDLHAAVSRARKEKNDSEKKKRTPFQEYLERKKQKKTERRRLEREKKRRQTTFSDDELPEEAIGDDDPFFSRRMPGDSGDLLGSGKTDRHAGSSADEASAEADEKRRQQLELLLMDESNDGRKHFSLKKIMQSEKKQAARKGKTAKAALSSEAGGDDFQINLNDPRFSAVYEDHRFNIDPTDASYRKTKAIQAIVSEKAKRRKVH